MWAWLTGFCWHKFDQWEKTIIRYHDGGITLYEVRGFKRKCKKCGKVIISDIKA